MRLVVTTVFLSLTADTLVSTPTGIYSKKDGTGSPVNRVPAKRHQ